MGFLLFLVSCFFVISPVCAIKTYSDKQLVLEKKLILKDLSIFKSPPAVVSPRVLISSSPLQPGQNPFSPRQKESMKNRVDNIRATLEKNQEILRNLYFRNLLTKSFVKGKNS